MNPWSKYIQSLIHYPQQAEPPTQAVVFARGKYYERTVFESSLTDGKLTQARCASCGARHLRFHIGYCAEERCPRCGRQLVTCGCFPERMLPWTRPILVH